MNVTLAMSGDLVASRRYAAEHGTTLNALIRDLLDGLRINQQEAAERKKAADGVATILQKCATKTPVGWKFNHEEFNLRNPGRGW